MARVISSIAGSRIEPKDSYTFIRGTVGIFKIIFLNNGVPTKVDTGFPPVVKIMQPAFLNSGGQPVPQLLATISGSLVAGQEFEYEFLWDIPANQMPIDDYVISYEGQLGGTSFNFGDEFFSVTAHAGMIATSTPMYATVDDVRKKKFNIDTYLPEQFRKDTITRNQIIEEHLRDATQRLREELNLNQARGFSINYRLFCVYYTVWSIMLASKGEDGSAVASENLQTWRSEWERILAVEKRRGVLQGVGLGRG